MIQRKSIMAAVFWQAIGLVTLVLLVLLTLLPQAEVLGQFNVPAPYPLSETFNLHSLPGATKTIYMDFDGHDGFEGNYTPYDFEGGPGTFTTNEKTEIQLAWQSVAEDFLPFDINITTEDPGTEALRKRGTGDTEWGLRVVVTDSVWDYSWAYVGSFNWDTDYEAFAWAPDANVGGGENGTDWLWVADSVSHEAGHALWLGHDGPGYYHGHGSGATAWAPIMGWTNFGLGQWSKGEYDGANNQEDDLAIITSQNGFGYRTDDHGSNTGSATPITDGVLAEGIIERNTDLDYFSFTMSSAGNVTFDINPNKVGADHWYGTGTVGANLDILAELRDSNDTVLHTSNPLNTIDASFDLNLAAGDYYLSIDGTGKGDPLATGYTDYGCLGYYSILGSGWDDVPDGDFNDDGAYNCADANALVAEIAAGTHMASFDLTGDGNVDILDMDAWRSEAGGVNLGAGKVYLEGDATLDGVVDGLDFIEWNNNKFTSLAEWCGGDFNADGIVDGLDFIVWNTNKFMSSDHVATVPEPHALIMLAAGAAGLGAWRKRRAGNAA